MYYYYNTDLMVFVFPLVYDVFPFFNMFFLCLSVQLTVLNAGRRYLGTSDLSGRVFVTSGLGGMSGAQAKAAVIAGCIGVIAEVIFFLLITNS